MAITVIGKGGVIADVDGATWRALRTTARPVDYGSLGSFRVSGISGTMAAGLAAASEIFQARWISFNAVALVWGLTLDGFSTGATGFAAGFASMTSTIARNWTADGSGGTALTPTGENQSLRTSMTTSLIGSVRISSTAALGAGTKTLDSQPVGQYTWSVNTAASTNFVSSLSLYESLEDGGNPTPIVLASNEGISIRTTVPATGVWQFGNTMSWSEVAIY